jgi:hypothetical protein
MDRRSLDPGLEQVGDISVQSHWGPGQVVSPEDLRSLGALLTWDPEAGCGTGCGEVLEQEKDSVLLNLMVFRGNLGQASPNFGINSLSGVGWTLEWSRGQSIISPSQACFCSCQKEGEAGTEALAIIPPTGSNDQEDLGSRPAWQKVKEILS